jgi:hypothetical protein
VLFPSCRFLERLALGPRRRRRYVHPKRQLTITRVHAGRSQKILRFSWISSVVPVKFGRVTWSRQWPISRIYLKWTSSHITRHYVILHAILSHWITHALVKHRDILNEMGDTNLTYFRNGCRYEYERTWKEHENPYLSIDIRYVFYLLFCKGQGVIPILPMWVTTVTHRLWLWACEISYGSSGNLIFHIFPISRSRME